MVRGVGSVGRPGVAGEVDMSHARMGRGAFTRVGGIGISPYLLLLPLLPS